MKSLYKMVAIVLFLTGCAGIERDCGSSCATSFGGDWIVVQYRADGSPINCWRLKDTAISNEPHTDGVFWQDPGGHLVHISGWYNRVQVQGNRWEEAARSIGVNDTLCKNGVYQSAAPDAGK